MFPQHFCNRLGCSKLITKGRYCAEHKPSTNKSASKNRPQPSERGYDQQWRATRRLFLSMHPNCRMCGRQATHVDHITPLRNGGTNNFSNLQALCHSCHSSKTARHDGGFGNGKRRLQ